MRTKTIFLIVTFTIFFTITIWGNVITRDNITQYAYNWEIISMWSPQKDTVHFSHYGAYYIFLK